MGDAADMHVDFLYDESDWAYDLEDLKLAFLERDKGEADEDAALDFESVPLPQ